MNKPMERAEQEPELTLAEKRVAAHVAQQFKKAVVEEQQMLADFVADFTSALCTAYGSRKLASALEQRLTAVMTATVGQPTRETLIRSALTAAARASQTRP